MASSDVRRVGVWIAGLITAAMAFLLLWRLAGVLLLLFGAILFAVLLDGLARQVCQRSAMGHGAALGLVIALIVTALAAGSFVLGPPLAEQVRQLFDQAPRGMAELRASLRDTAWGRTIIDVVPPEILRGEVNGGLIRRLGGVFSTVAGAVGSALAVVVIGLYLAVRPAAYTDGVIHLVRPERRDRARAILAAVGHALRRWLVGRLVAMIAVAIMTAVGLWILGIPAALGLAVLAGLLTFVPFLGPVLAAVPAVAVAFVQSPMDAVYVVVLYTGVQAIENNLITPLVEQRAVSLPAALMLGFEVVMAVLAGFLGILLATPLLVVGVLLVQMLYVQDVLGDDITVLAEDEERPTRRPAFRWLRDRGSRWLHPPRPGEARGG